MATFSTLDMPPRESFDLWCDVTRHTYDMPLPKAGQREMRLSAELRRGRNLVLSNFVCQRNYKWRSPSHIAGDGRPYFKLRRYLRGSAVFVSDGKPWQLHSGATYLLDQSRPFVELSDDNQQINVFVPQDALAFDGKSRHPVIEWSDSSPEGHILRAALDQLFAEAFGGQNQSFDAAEESFCKVLRGVLSSASESFSVSAVRDARHRAIKAEIDRWLQSSRAENIETLVAALPFSRASLYRHFPEPGGIASFLRKRRLELAFQELSKTGSRRGAISRTAIRAGYASVHSFTKAFKREFGYSPGEVIGSRGNNNTLVEGWAIRDPHATPGAVEFIHAFRSIRAA